MIWILLTACTPQGQDTVAAPLDPCLSYGAPQLRGTVQDAALDEISGLVARSEGGFWAIEDSGAPAEIHALGEDGALIGTWAVEGATNVDWEDLARTDTHLWIGDFGDNSQAREGVVLWKVSEVLDEPAERIDAVYEDGAHDAETLLVDAADEVWILTKSYSGETGVYHLVDGTLVREGALQFGSDALPGGTALTAGDWAPDRIVLRTYTSVFLWEVAEGQSVAEALAGPPCELVGPDEGQGEALALNDQGFYTVSEGTGQPLYAAPRKD